MPTQVWRNNNSLQLVSTRVPAGSENRKFLVFVVPRRDLRSPLLGALSGFRNYDLAVRFYEDPGLNVELLAKAEFVMTGGLSKFHSAELFLNELKLHNAYEGYLFLDGDLEFDGALLPNFLSFAHAAGLDLAQPAVTRDSYCYWKMAYHQPGYIFRETSFVEVMAPFLSHAALLKTVQTFTQSISTYGLDLVWPSLVGSKRIAVVDAFQIRHRDRVDHASGSFYKYLKSIGVDLDKEERLILEKYGVEAETAHSRRGYFWKRAWPFLNQPRELVSVALNAPETRTEKQILVDLEMRRARWRSVNPEPALERAIRPFLNGNHVSSD